jgi:hypothetical protein
LTLSDTNIFDTKGGGTITTNITVNEVKIQTTTTDNQYFLSKESYRIGFRVTCDIKTENADVAIFLVPKQTFDAKSSDINNVSYQDGIRYGPGDNSNPTRYAIKVMDRETFISTINTDYNSYSLEYRGSTNTIVYYDVNGTKAQQNFTNPASTEYFHIGILVWADTIGYVKNFRVEPA